MRKISSLVTNRDPSTGGFSEGKFRDNPGNDTGSAATAKIVNDLYYGVIGIIKKYLGDVSDAEESESANDALDAIEEMASIVGPQLHQSGFDYEEGSVVFNGSIEYRANRDIDTGSDGATFASQNSAGAWTRVDKPLKDEFDALNVTGTYSDANNIVNNGWDLLSAGASNSPGSVEFYIYSNFVDSSNGTQIAVGSVGEYRRIRDGGTWGSWSPLGSAELATTTITDADSATNNGKYFLQSGSSNNGPDAGEWLIDVTIDGAGNLTQRSVKNAKMFGMMFRLYFGGSWTPWFGFPVKRYDTNRKYVLSSFASPGTSPTGIAFDGTNLISCDNSSNTIYVHDGVSSTILSSFSSPGIEPQDLAFDGTNLISCDNSSNTIYVHDGVSSTILSSFASPSTNTTGLTFDGTNLISCDNGTDTIYVHDGISSTILSSFASPSTSPTGIAFDGTNLISCDVVSDTIYVHDGISSTILSSFASPGTSPTGIAFDGTNLISCDAASDTIYVHQIVYPAASFRWFPQAIINKRFASPSTLPTGLTFDGTNLISCDDSTNTIYVHDGISSTILSSFTSPGINPTSLTFDGTNLISCDAASDTIYVHDGISSTILSSFSSPSTSPRGLAFDGTNLISSDIDSDTIYVHDGISSTILSSFASPSTSPRGIVFDGTNLISCDQNADTIYVHDGISSTILSSFASQGTSPTGIAFDGTNLISCDAASGTIYVHQSYLVI
jgi:DNA-binding beta-propeller fold protein YncE